MRIECSECQMYQSSHCDDCLVTALLHPLDDAVDIDEALDAPLRTLSGAGLIPVLKFRPRDPVPEAAPGEAADAAAEAG
jgi:hypothetical protein